MIPKKTYILVIDRLSISNKSNQSTSVFIRFLLPLGEIIKKYNLNIQIEIVKNIQDFQVYKEKKIAFVCCSRNWDNEILNILELSKKSNIPVIYDIDDCVWDKNPSWLKLRKEFNQEVFISQLKLSDILIFSTEKLLSLFNIWIKDKIKFIQEKKVIPIYLTSNNKKLYKLNEDSKLKVVYTSRQGIKSDKKKNVENIILDIVNHPKVRSFYTIGFCISSLKNNIKYKSISEMPVKKYLEFINSNQFDIGISILQEDKYSLGKAPIKYIEYSAMNTVGIYNSYHPYKDLIIDGINGICFSELSNLYPKLKPYLDNPTKLNDLKNFIKIDYLKNMTLENQYQYWVPIFEKYKL